MPAPQTQSPAAERDVYVDLYEAKKKIYPRAIGGVFTRWRWALMGLSCQSKTTPRRCLLAIRARY